MSKWAELLKQKAAELQAQAPAPPPAGPPVATPAEPPAPIPAPLSPEDRRAAQRAIRFGGAIGTSWSREPLTEKEEQRLDELILAVGHITGTNRAAASEIADVRRAWKGCLRLLLWELRKQVSP